MSNFSINYTGKIGNTGPARHVVLKHIKPDDRATVGELANLLDDLYGVDKCEPDPGSQAEREPVSVEDFQAAVKANFQTVLCGMNEDGNYEADIHVIRDNPYQNYSLNIAGGWQVSLPVIFEGSMTRIFEVKNIEYLEIEYPILSKEIPEVEWYGESVGISLTGHGVAFTKQVSGVLRLKFWTKYEKIKVEIFGTGLGAPEKCRMLCFYAGEVADLEIEAPVIDDVSPLDKLNMCGGSAGVDNSDIECYKTITETVHCSCGCDLKETRTVEQVVPCPDTGLRVSGGRAKVGDEKRKIYESCGEEGGEETGYPDNYEEACCEPPEEGQELPPCKEYCSANTGQEIENGAEYWQNRYGDDVVLIPIMPDDGNCGVVKTTVNINSKNCDDDDDDGNCENAEPVLWSEENPETISPGSSTVVSVTGGTGAITWTVSGSGFTFDNGGTTIIAGNSVKIHADAAACGSAGISATDSCGSGAGGSLRSTDGRWVERYNSAHSTGNDESAKICGEGTQMGLGYRYEIVRGDTKTEQSWSLSNQWYSAPRDCQTNCEVYNRPEKCVYDHGTWAEDLCSCCVSQTPGDCCDSPRPPDCTRAAPYLIPITIRGYKWSC